MTEAELPLWVAFGNLFNASSLSGIAIKLVPSTEGNNASPSACVTFSLASKLFPRFFLLVFSCRWLSLIKWGVEWKVG